MMMFPLALIVIGCLFFWQSIEYIRVPRGHQTRKMVLIRLVGLLAIVSLIAFAWRATLIKSVTLLPLLPAYPGSALDLFHTPIFTQTQYWTYRTKDSPDQIFNWYRSRAKHAGWMIEDQGGSGRQVFVVTTSSKAVIFVILMRENDTTTVVYTTEGSMTTTKQ